jgi:hypothetical protein
MDNKRSYLTFLALRGKHPELKRRHWFKFWTEVNRLQGKYLDFLGKLNGISKAREQQVTTAIDQLLAGLSQLERDAIVSYFEGMTEDVKMRLAELPPASE